LRRSGEIMSVMFYEIDNGPGGITWELHTEDDILRSYPTEADMLYDAALLYNLHHEVKFFTQQEYNLNVQMETMVESEIFGRKRD
jgi:hypothetical protein